MNAFCPNLSNKQVRQEFAELVQAVGEDAAYFLWDKNNGYSLESAPNGAPSKLFKDLLDYYKGDRQKAFQTKAKVYSKAFKDWFGDWQSEDKTNVSKVIDENGEPSVVYHGGQRGIDVFLNMDENPNYKNTKHQGYWAKDRVGIYFSKYKGVAEGYASSYKKKNKNVYPVFLNMRNPFQQKIITTKINTIKNIFKNKENRLITPDLIHRFELENSLKGHDGINHSNGTEYVVFNSNQIKSIENNGEFSTEDNNIYHYKLPANISDDLLKATSSGNAQIFFKNSTDINTSTILKDLIQNNFISDHLKPLANVLQYHEIPVIYASEDATYFMRTIVDKNNRVIISINSKLIDKLDNEYVNQILMHEIIHALTVKELENKYGDFYKYTSKIYKTYKKYFGNVIDVNDPLFYGLNDINEFVAEFITNSDFKQQLIYAAQELDSKSKNNIVRTLFNKFINSIVNFFSNKNVIRTSSEQLKQYTENLTKYITDAKSIKRGNFKTSDALKAAIKNIQTDATIMEGIVESYKDFQTSLNLYKTYDKTMSQSINEKIQNYRRKHNINIQNEETVQSTDSDLQKDPKQLLDDISAQIAKTLEIRKKAVKSQNIPDYEKNKIIQGIDAQIKAFSGTAVDRIEQLWYFTGNVFVDIINESEKITQAANRIYQNGKSQINSDEYMSELHDFIGVYKYIFDKIKDFVDRSSTKYFLETYQQGNNQINKNYDKFIDRLTMCRNLIDTSMNFLKGINQFNIAEILRQLGQDTGNSADMENYISTQLGGETTQDIWSINKLFGSADKVQDNIVRSISMMISKAVSTANIKSLDRCTTLLDLQDKLKMNHSVYDLYEKDDNGLPTGYVVRKINYGKYEFDYREFLAELNAKYSTLEEPLAPDNRIPPTNPSVRKQWFTERNEWLDAHGHRRFTKDFYAKFGNLSYETYCRRMEIQTQINDLNRKCMVVTKDGQYFDRNKLSEDDKKRLSELQTLRRQLISPLYPDGTEKPEGSVDKIVADELSELNKSLYSTNRGKKNIKLWQKLRDQKIKELESEYAKGEIKDKNYVKKELSKWDAVYSRISLKGNKNGDGFELFDDVEKARQEVIKKWEQKLGKGEIDFEYPEEYEQNRKLIKELQSAARDSNTGEIIAERLTNQQKVKILQLQKQNYKILKEFRRQLHFKNGSKVDKKTKRAIFKSLKEINEQYYTTEYTQEFLDGYEEARLKDLEANQNADALDITGSSTGYLAKFLASHGQRLIDFDGNPIGYKAHSFYTKVMPVDFEKYGQIEPGDAFIMQDEDSLFLDKEFDESEGESVVPKLKGVWKGKPFNYDNSDAYNKIISNEDLKNMYNETLKILNEVKNIYSNIPYISSYKLPSIQRGLFSQTRSSSLKSKIGKALTLLKRKFIITDQDVESNKVAALRPDHRDLSFIPQPYVARLEDPTTISSDLVMMLQEYYNRAVQYQEKRKIQNKCEAMLDYLADRKYVSKKSVKLGSQTETYQMAETTIKTQLYDMQEPNGSVGKTIKLFGKMASALNLGLNPIVAFTGMLTTAHAHLMNAIVGKKYGLKEMTQSFWIVSNSLLQSAMGWRILGNNSKLLQQNLMEFFNITDQGNKKFLDTRMNRVAGTLKRNFIYGLMTMSDYLIKSQILDSVLLSFRYVDGEFITRDQLVYKYYKKGVFGGGEEYKTKIKEWQNGITLYNVMAKSHNKEGKMFNIPQEYKKSFDKVYYVAMSRAQKYAALADGTVTPAQRSAITYNYIGSLIMMHRNYLPGLIQSRFGSSVYDMDTQEYTTGIFKVLLELLYGPIIDGYKANKLLKQSEPETKGFAKFKKIIKEVNVKEVGRILDVITNPINRWALKQVIAESAFHVSVTLPIVSLILSMANDPENDDDWVLQFIAYLAVRVQWETMSAYRGTDILNNIRSATAATSLTDGIDQVFQTFNSIKIPENSLWNLYTNFIPLDFQNENLKENNQMVTRGAYFKFGQDIGIDITKSDRALIKITPFKNLIQQRYGAKDSRNYYMKQVMKE